jgi:hypothetical protein
MRFYNKVIVRRGKRWQLGKIKRMKFVPEMDIDGPDSVKGDYIPLAEYTFLIGHDYTKKEVTDIRKKIGYTEIRVLDKPCRINKATSGISEKSWDSFFWKFTNPLCGSCSMGCKQSSRIVISKCPDYK